METEVEGLCIHWLVNCLFSVTLGVFLVGF